MFTNQNFRRRVHIRHRPGGISVRIERQNSRGHYFFGMCMSTVFFIAFSNVVISAARRNSAELLMLPLLVLGLACYAIALAICVWGAFGLEEIVVEAGTLRWTRVALKWRRTRDISAKDIREVNAITPWHGLNNTVEVITHRTRQTIGDKLLHDEAIELAHRLRGAVGSANRCS